MSDIAWTGDAMSYAKAHVEAGVLHIDDEGRIWRRRIWSGRRIGNGRWKDIAARRAENVGGKGYLRVSLWTPDGRLAIVMAHNLVYEIQVGSIPDALELNHKNLIKTDNRIDNLEPVTPSRNTKHAYEHGRVKPWTYAEDWRPGRRRLSRSQISQIRRLRANGIALKEVARRVGISISHTARVARGQHSRR